MKKWLRFFCLSFFSDKVSKEGARRGYTNVLLSLVLVFVFLWAGFIGSDMLPLKTHYNNSPDFKATVHALLANPELDKRIETEIKDGALTAMKNGEDSDERLLVNTYENELDRANYSLSGYNVIVDMHTADTLAEFEAYCVSNDGQSLTITYEEYLSLSAVARLNFDFKLRYTGKALELTDELIESCKAYIESLGTDAQVKYSELEGQLVESKITKAEYDRAVYEIYFVNYYPEITAYESTSSVPLLRNYYYHQYISQGERKYLFIFDDYMSASFETAGGTDVSFYGFYNGMDDGVTVEKGASAADAIAAADDFIERAMLAIAPLTLYAHAMNIFTLIPFIALMPLVVTLLAYSIMRLSGIESIATFGAMFRIFASYMWVCGAISAVLGVILSFFAHPSVITTLPLVLFFVTLAARSVVFAVREVRSYIKQTEQEETVLTEA